jgi:uncharacterized protein YacL
MGEEQIHNQFIKLKNVLLVVAGAVGILLVTTIADYPILKAARAAWSGEVLITGWFGLWLILVIIPASLGFYILLGRTYRQVSFKTRINIGFGYLVSAWFATLAIQIRTLMLELPFLFHFIVIFSGLILTILYFALSRNAPAEEIFP